MLWSNCKIKVHGDFSAAADTERRSLSRAEDGGCLEMNGTLNSGAPPAQLESCPAATETDIHANHNRNDRPGHHTTRPDSHFKPDLPASQPASPDRQQATPPEVPPLCLRRQTGTNWDNPPPPSPLPPTLPLHCAPQQPLLRGLIPRSDHHLYLLC